MSWTSSSLFTYLLIPRSLHRALNSTGSIPISIQATCSGWSNNVLTRSNSEALVALSNGAPPKAEEVIDCACLSIVDDEPLVWLLSCDSGVITLVCCIYKKVLFVRSLFLFLKQLIFYVCFVQCGTTTATEEADLVIAANKTRANDSLFDSWEEITCQLPNSKKNLFGDRILVSFRIVIRTMFVGLLHWSRVLCQAQCWPFFTILAYNALLTATPFYGI